MAKDRALATLESIARTHKVHDDEFRTDLLNIARTTLSSKLLTQQKEHFSNIAVDAVLRLKGKNDLQLIKIIKKPGGSLKDSYLENGFILEKTITVGCPKKLTNVKIMIANTPMDTDRIKIYGAKVKTDSLHDLEAIEAAEKQKMKDKVNKILAYKPDVFINRQLV